MGLLAWLACSAQVEQAEVPEAPVEVQSIAVEAPEAARLPPPFTDRLLPWDAEREALTVAYLNGHYGLEVESSAIAPRMVVLHWTAGGSADGAFNTFSPTRLQGRKELAAAGAVNVSAHFLVDRDGTTWRLVPTDKMARHVIGLNHVAIGIENVGDGERWPLTEAQVEANAALIRWLAQEHELTHVIGHHEYRQMEGHPYWAEQDAGYRTVKVDPGPEFLAAVMERVADLGLEGAPEGR